MKKADIARLPENDMRRYDWSRARRGRLAARAAKAAALMRVIDADLAKRFPDSRSVNEALRTLITVEETVGKKKARGRKAA
jgi:hypothetical protein